MMTPIDLPFTAKSRPIRISMQLCWANSHLSRRSNHCSTGGWPNCYRAKHRRVSVFNQCSSTLLIEKMLSDYVFILKWIDSMCGSTDVGTMTHVINDVRIHLHPFLQGFHPITRSCQTHPLRILMGLVIDVRWWTLLFGRTVIETCTYRCIRIVQDDKFIFI